MDETIVIDTDSINYEKNKEVLRDICLDLEERGYNAYKQVTEYLLTGEVGYISSYKECRSRIQKLSRRDIVEYMLKDFIS